VSVWCNRSAIRVKACVWAYGAVSCQERLVLLLATPRCVADTPMRIDVACMYCNDNFGEGKPKSVCARHGEITGMNWKHIWQQSADYTAASTWWGCSTACLPQTLPYSCAVLSNTTSVVSVTAKRNCTLRISTYKARNDCDLAEVIEMALLAWTRTESAFMQPLFEIGLQT